MENRKALEGNERKACDAVASASTVSSISTKKTEIFEGTCQVTFDAQEVIDVLQWQGFHILLRICFCKVIKATQSLGGSVYYTTSYVRDSFLVHSPSSPPKRYHRKCEFNRIIDEDTASCKAAKITAHGGAHKAKKQRRINRLLL